MKIKNIIKKIKQILFGYEEIEIEDDNSLIDIDFDDTAKQDDYIWDWENVDEIEEDNGKIKDYKVLKEKLCEINLLEDEITCVDNIIKQLNNNNDEYKQYYNSIFDACLYLKNNKELINTENVIEKTIENYIYECNNRTCKNVYDKLARIFKKTDEDYIKLYSILVDDNNIEDYARKINISENGEPEPEKKEEVIVYKKKKWRKKKEKKTVVHLGNRDYTVYYTYKLALQKFGKDDKRTKKYFLKYIKEEFLYGDFKKSITYLYNPYKENLKLNNQDAVEIKIYYSLSILMYREIAKKDYKIDWNEERNSILNVLKDTLKLYNEQYKEKDEKIIELLNFVIKIYENKNLKLNEIKELYENVLKCKFNYFSIDREIFYGFNDLDVKISQNEAKWIANENGRLKTDFAESDGGYYTYLAFETIGTKLETIDNILYWHISVYKIDYSTYEDDAFCDGEINCPNGECDCLINAITGEYKFCGKRIRKEGD